MVPDFPSDHVDRLDRPGPVDPTGSAAGGSGVAGRIAAAAHELRTPLNGILGFADLLVGTGLTQEQAAYVTQIRRSGTALLGLVDDMLDLGRLEAGRPGHPPEAVSLEGLVEDVAELLAPRAHAKGLELVAFVAPGLPVEVAVDPLLLRQVLLNLGGNAVKYTETGGVAIEVEATTTGRIGFRVRDTGIGIAPADAERIFAAFERVAEADDERDGSGLGLAIARAVVARLGGEIRLVSRLGEGSTFAFDLDLAPLAAARPVVRPLAGRRVLLLSEGRVAPPVLARRLHGLGAEVSVADSVDGPTGDPPDVVIVDAASGHAGFRLGEARARFGDGFRAVVALRPLDRAMLPQLRAAGFEGHLIEPIRSASLAATVLGPAPAIAAESAASSASAPDARRSLDVLLVDDNEINGLLGRAALEHAGHRVRVATDGRSGLAMVDAATAGGQPFDVVLMDLHMPDFDGFTAIEALCAGRGACRLPRIVAVTADATTVAAERAIACGADAVLTKPIDRERLGRLLDRIVAPESSAAAIGAA